MDQTRKSLPITVDQRRIAAAFFEVHGLCYRFCHISTPQTEHRLVLLFR